jgi:hypothetical protein
MVPSLPEHARDGANVDRFHTTYVVVFWFVVLSAELGCAEKSRGPEENKAANHLRKIAQAFDLAQYKGSAPKNAEEIKPLLKQLSKDEEPDAMLRSPNDGEPYEVAWGARLDRQTDLKAILAYEKKGVDGKRYVITVARIVLQMNDADFEAATFVQGR